MSEEARDKAYRDFMANLTSHDLIHDVFGEISENDDILIESILEQWKYLNGYAKPDGDYDHKNLIVNFLSHLIHRKLQDELEEAMDEAEKEERIKANKKRLALGIHSTSPFGGE